MDKRDLAKVFKARFRHLLDGEERGLSGFLSDAGMDRSALSKFLDKNSDRLPRAERLRAIAAARGVSVDWLLGLSNAPDGRQEVAPSVQIERSVYSSGGTPLDAWRTEAAGFKLRYVPSLLPDMLSLAEHSADAEHAEAEAAARGIAAENVLSGFKRGEMDVEIAMPMQTLESLAEGSGLFRRVNAGLRASQLTHMAAICDEAYPTLRLHLYDGTETFSAPFTVFGKIRAAVYLGEAYMVVTSGEQVEALTRVFDNLVRNSVVGPDRVYKWLLERARRA